MVTIRDLSERIGSFLSRTIDEPEKALVLTYGLELIIGETLKLVILILIAYILGLLTPTLFVLSTVIPLRILTGGQHSSSNLRCLTLTLIIILPLAFLSRYFSTVMNNMQSLSFAFIASVFFITILEQYGPGFSINYAEVSSETRKKVKVHSYIFVTIWLIAVLVYLFFSNNARLVSLVITSASVGVVWQGLLLTPLGHRFIKEIDTTLVSLKIR